MSKEKNQEDTQIEKRPIEVNQRGLVLKTIDDMYRFSQAVVLRGMAPKGLNTPEQVLVVIQAGAELGLTPMRSLASIYVVNGKTQIYGDTPLALVRQSGLMEWIKEYFEGEDDAFTAVCIVQRKGDPEPVERRFSIADAKQANLWGKSGPWTSYWKRMLQMRARALGLRDVFPDCFAGAAVAEEYIGVEEERTEPKSAELLGEPAKVVESTQTDTWDPEKLPLGAPPNQAPDHKDTPDSPPEAVKPSEGEAEAPKWHCKGTNSKGKECNNDFVVPLPNGLCPKCLSKEIEEIANGDV